MNTPISSSDLITNQASAQSFLHSLYNRSVILASTYKELNASEDMEIIRNIVVDYLAGLFVNAVHTDENETSLPSPISFNRLPSGLSKAGEEEIILTEAFLEDVYERCYAEGSQIYGEECSTRGESFFPLNETVLKCCIEGKKLSILSEDSDLGADIDESKLEGSPSLDKRPAHENEKYDEIHDRVDTDEGNSKAMQNYVENICNLVKDTDKYLRNYLESTLENRIQSYRRTLSMPAKLNDFTKEEVPLNLAEENSKVSLQRVHFKRCDSIKVDDKFLSTPQGNKMVEVIEEILEAEVHEKVETLAIEAEREDFKLLSDKKKMEKFLVDLAGNEVDSDGEIDDDVNSDEEEDEINVQSLVESVLIDVDSQTKNNLNMFNRCHSLDLITLYKQEKTEEPYPVSRTIPQEQTLSQKKARVRKELIHIIDETLREEEDRENEIELRRRTISELFFYDVEDEEIGKIKELDALEDFGETSSDTNKPDGKRRLRVLSEFDENLHYIDRSSCSRHVTKSKKFNEDQENINPSLRNISANNAKDDSNYLFHEKNQHLNNKGDLKQGFDLYENSLKSCVSQKYTEARLPFEQIVEANTALDSGHAEQPYNFQTLDWVQKLERNSTGRNSIQPISFAPTERDSPNQKAYRLPNIYTKVDVRDFIAVNHENFNFGVLFPGNIVEEDLELTNTSQSETIILKVQIKCLNTELDSLEEYVYSMRKITSYDYNEKFIVVIGPNSSISFKLALKVPSLKVHGGILGYAEISLRGFEDQYWRIPINCYVEIPKLICPKELYVEKIQSNVLKLAAKSGRKQEFKIPFKNLSILSLCLENEVFTPAECPLVNSYEIVVYPPILNVNTMAQCVINIVIKPLYILGGRMPYRGEELKRILLVKVRNTPIIFSYPISVEFY